MLLSAPALPNANMVIGSTETFTEYVPMELDELNASSGYWFAERMLPVDSQCLLTDITYAAGTVVRAPLVPVRMQNSQLDHSDQLVPTWRTAYAFCAHDHPALASDGTAYFYEAAVLDAILTGERLHGHVALFDPLTFGDGTVAALRLRGQADAVAALEPAWIRSRGRWQVEHSASFGSARIPGDYRQRPRLNAQTGCQTLTAVRAPHELNAINARLWHPFVSLPRAAAHQLPLNPALSAGETIHFGRGSDKCLCAEGSVVHSAAAWCVRRDFRLRPDADAVPLDTPLIVYTANTMEAWFLAAGDPLVQTQPYQPPGLLQRGVACLSADPLTVWSVVGQVPAGLVNADGNVTQLPYKVSIGSGDAFRVADTRQALVRALFLEPYGAETPVTLIYRSGERLRLLAQRCAPGEAVMLPVDAPVVYLPSPPRSRDAVVLGLQLAWKSYDFADVLDRVQTGAGPPVDAWGRLIGQTPLSLLPAAAPYDAWSRDAREQNLLWTVPYRPDDIPWRLIDALQSGDS